MTVPPAQPRPHSEPPLLHVVPGPERHGVVRHGLALQEHLDGVELLRCDRLDELGDGAFEDRRVVVQVTDRVLAGDLDLAGAAWRRVTRGAARITVVLHDLPQRSDGRSRERRSRLYAELAATADEVVLASEHERLLLAAVLRWARPERARPVLARTHVIPLPVERRAVPEQGAAGPAPGDGTADPPLTVVTQGFVYPGKGLGEVIDATALAAHDPRLAGRRVAVRNLGGASDGHDDLLAELAARAARAGIVWSTTGWVDDAELPGLLDAATVPVAAHRHLSASGSVATWLGADRRPLVLASRYAEELADRLPGALTLVVAPPRDGVVASLASAIADALADPSTTWLGPEVELGPSWAEAAERLRDLAARPAVSVVVPYYRDQELLDLVLERLAAQEGVVGGLEVVVADDGSPEPPDVGAGPGTDNDRARGALAAVKVVRQSRDGFRAAAARNLGARAAAGRVLAFIDGDTVPEDGCVAALQRICLASSSPTLAVGRRRHADLRGEGGGRHTWPPTRPLEEPAWLAHGYAVSDDLRAADDTSFRFVISAVMAVTRTVWDAVGGFDEGLTGYGGEDWELGWRCWLAGADLRHVPEAVAWHDGPDLAGRDAARLAEVKNGETARLAPRLPHPLVRGRGWWHPQPDVVVLVRSAGWTQGQVAVVVGSLLRQGDVGVWVDRDEADRHGGAGSGGLEQWADPRVRCGRPPGAVLARARATVDVTRPVAVRRLPWEPWPQELTGTLARGRSPLVDDPASGVRVCSTRYAARRHLHGEPEPPAWLPQGWTEPVEADVVVERWRQRWPA